MAPLVPVFSSESLPSHVNTIRRNFHEEKRRKGPAVDLKECPLLEMVQYSCNPPQDGIPKPGTIVCKPVVRLFRRCAGLTVETTSWEPIRLAKEEEAKRAA
ncbi:uncharacterized protein ACHE_20047S [Aspergillus chevalieri]|uniref:Mitochondrial export protein Som1 n=2 Tax=Aspergillus subgen. Aspergillus TaxID=2720874 RepID=A0A1E3B1Q3_ASPCR|nr:uncharacterized protein ACHE_20047S [Aspergillus chevalieri]ODM14771.1 hypothetical protein SI65_09765 [Aspergillus cristatus]BCR84589.1 hypothetical protein ACHE_20047S [Aspergillus chevalieri]